MLYTSLCLAIWLRVGGCGMIPLLPQGGASDRRYGWNPRREATIVIAIAGRSLPVSPRSPSSLLAAYGREKSRAAWSIVIIAQPCSWRLRVWNSRRYYAGRRRGVRRRCLYLSPDIYYVYNTYITYARALTPSPTSWLSYSPSLFCLSSVSLSSRNWHSEPPPATHRRRCIVRSRAVSEPCRSVASKGLKAESRKRSSSREQARRKRKEARPNCRWVARIATYR